MKILIIHKKNHDLNMMLDIQLSEMPRIGERVNIWLPIPPTVVDIIWDYDDGIVTVVVK